MGTKFFCIGLRVGYGIFPLNLIEYLWRIKQPYNVSVVAEIAACAALSNPAYLEVLALFRLKILKFSLLIIASEECISNGEEKNVQNDVKFFFSQSI